MTLARRSPRKSAKAKARREKLEFMEALGYPGQAIVLNPGIPLEVRDAVMLRSHGRCEARTGACPPGAHEGHHMHHRRLRSQGGKHTALNLLLLCHLAHTYVHAHPAESYENLWMIRGPG